MSETPAPDPTSPEAPHDPRHILVVRRGVGANCSSIGSAVEMLFLSATVGAAILAAVSAAMPPVDEPVDEPPDGPAAPDPGASGPTPPAVESRP